MTGDYRDMTLRDVERHLQTYDRIASSTAAPIAENAREMVKEMREALDAAARPIPIHG